VRPAPHPRRLRLLTRHAARAELVAAILKRGGLMCAHPPAAPCAPARLAEQRCALAGALGQILVPPRRRACTGCTRTRRR
jgi:hypothetical protein